MHNERPFCDLNPETGKTWNLWAASNYWDLGPEELSVPARPIKMVFGSRWCLVLTYLLKYLLNVLPNFSHLCYHSVFRCKNKIDCLVASDLVCVLSQSWDHFWNFLSLKSDWDPTGGTGDNREISHIERHKDQLHVAHYHPLLPQYQHYTVRVQCCRWLWCGQ